MQSKAGPMTKKRPSSISEIPDSERLLATYVDPSNSFAWPLYDLDFAPDQLTGADLAAPALLSYPVKGDYLNAMGRNDSPYHELVRRMQLVLDAAPQEFWAVPRLRLEGVEARGRHDVGIDDAFGRLIACFDQVGECQGLTSVFVTKVLHRKRPALVPINDSRLRDFYGVEHRYAPLLVAVHDDVAAHLDLLVELGGRHTPNIAPLRVLDIVIWMHQAPS